MSLPVPARARPTTDSGLLVIGASTGGVRALSTLFQNLPPINAAVLIVQHMPAFIEPSFVRSLQGYTRMRVAMAHDGDLMRPGQVLIAPADIHCALEQNTRIRLVHGPRVNYVCPAVDVAMKSVVASGRNAPMAGVLLTGMGRDGADGMVHMRRLGAYTVAQDEASCAVFGMPKEAWIAGGAETLLPPERIARRLAFWLGALPKGDA